MADITTAFVKQFHSNIEILCQQKGSKLRNLVRLKDGVVGEETYIDQIGATEAVEKTTRHGDTPLVDTEFARRKIALTDWEWADLIDKSDKLKMLADPTSEYVQNAAFALGRAMDKKIVAAAFGTAYTGKDGTTPKTFAAEGAGDIAEGASGLTLTKLLEAKEILDDKEVDEDEPRFIVVTAAQITNLLNTTEVKSADYNTVKALVNGQIDTFLGFKFVRISSSILEGDGSDTRYVIAFAKNGLGLAIAADIKTRITERADKSYSTQVFASMGIGATRVDGDKVVRINCLY